MILLNTFFCVQSFGFECRDIEFGFDPEQMARDPPFKHAQIKCPGVMPGDFKLMVCQIGGERAVFLTAVAPVMLDQPEQSR